VPTPALNAFIESITAANPPVSPGRKHVRIMYAAQIGVEPPSFVFFTNVATTFHFSYERFLINQLRDKFGFVGSPIKIQVRRRERNANVGGDRSVLGRRTKKPGRERGGEQKRKDRRS
jgi:GTPase